jgi:hypothetical protein
MEPKPGTPFWRCPSCGRDTEPDFDHAVLRGFEIGIDLTQF